MTEAARFNLKLGDQSFPLESGQTYIVGSGLLANIRVAHGSVSATHCELAVGDALVVVTDLRSAAGTKMDGTLVESAPWEPGHGLMIGEIPVQLLRATYTAKTMPGAIEAPLRRREATFGELMHDELKRTPWFALSTVIHAAILLALYYFYPTYDELNPPNRTIAMEAAEEQIDANEEDETPKAEETKEMEDEDLQDLEIEFEDEEIIVENFENDVEVMGMNEGDLLSKVSSGTGDDILKLGKGALSGGFKKTVSKLRQSGLEIVFVFDSTGSMGAVLQATKERIGRMMEVLHSLVPHSRIGIITYRDRGPTESYLTRSVPLSSDFYRATNFMQRIYAGGGADEPEAVYDGLKLAVNQQWQKKSRRLIILVGDAPPHSNTNSKIQGLIRGFVRRGKSYVHAFVTSPNGSSDMNKETQRAFKKIASAGKGECLDFDNEAKILKSTLSLAFGRDYKKSLEEVYKLVENRNQKVSTFAKELVRRGDRDQLLKQFARPQIRDDVVRALIQSRNKEAVAHLIDFLRMRDKLSGQGRHAASYVVQTLLDLDEPPVDPERGAVISQRRARVLKRRANNRL